ncbi:MAG: energy-coupling factor transporter ATPase [Lachnospiraceae bacterium]
MKDDMQLIVDHISYQYNKGTNLMVKALDDVNLIIHKKEFLGLIGHTGSGKSTLVQHLNGLLQPDSGTVYFNGEDVFAKGYQRKQLRSKVGLVFQYPEHQLFAETVFEDVCFGPKNLGLSEEDAELAAYDALRRVGLEETYYTQSPFELSGGQMRRVAIAGVLAMQPEIMILDEPTAGLDPKGRKELLSLIKRLNEEHGITIVLVSHSMEDIAEYAKRIVVIDGGKVQYDDIPSKVFANYKHLETMGLMAPEMTYIMHELCRRGFDVDVSITTMQDAKNAILQNLGI